MLEDFETCNNCHFDGIFFIGLVLFFIKKYTERPSLFPVLDYKYVANNIHDKLPNKITHDDDDDDDGLRHPPPISFKDVYFVLIITLPRLVLKMPDSNKRLLGTCKVALSVPITQGQMLSRADGVPV